MKADLRCVLAIAMLVASLGTTAATGDDYAWSFQLDTDGHRDAYRVELTSSVYAHTLPQAGLRDLVVVNAEGQQVPFGLMPQSQPWVHAYQATLPLVATSVYKMAAEDGSEPQDAGGGDQGHTAVVAVESGEGGVVINLAPPATGSRPGVGVQAGIDGVSIVAGQGQRLRAWLLDAGDAVDLESMQLLLPESLGDVQWQVEVEAADVPGYWDWRRRDIAITRITRDGVELDSRSIDFPGDNGARFYRLWLPASVRVAAGGAGLRAVLKGTTTDYPLRRSAQEEWEMLTAEQGDGGGTDFDYRLPAPLPVSAVQIDPAGTNVAGRFVVSAGQGDGEVLQRMTVAETGSGEDTLDLHRFEPRRLLQLHLHSDNRLAHAPRLRVVWQPATFVFLAHGPGPYRLLAGSATAKRGDYPLRKALLQLRGQAGDDWPPAYADIGPVTQAAGEAALNTPEAPFDWTRWLLLAVLVAAALLVIAMAVSLVRGGGKH